MAFLKDNGVMVRVDDGVQMDSKLKTKILKSLNNLNKVTTKIQGIMKEASTSRPSEYMFSPKEYMDLFEDDYKLAYSAINDELDFLEKNNIDLIHENPFESLKDFYNYYKDKLKSYESRREYISSLYAGIEKQIDEYKEEVKSIESKKLPSVEKFIDYHTYHDILRTINDTGKNFEKYASSFNKKSEEELRDHILVNLEARHRLSTTGETFNKSGKTDIIIRHEGTTIFIAECKFWAGEISYFDTISQLLGYLTWRDSRTAVVIFVKNKKISPVLNKVEKCTPDHSNYVEYVNSESESWHNYIFHINDDKGIKFNLTVLLFHLPND